jgi:hypothetical protein
MDEFNNMLSKEDLSEEQLNICRDIRRRGKNKVGKKVNFIFLLCPPGCSSELQEEENGANR